MALALVLIYIIYNYTIRISIATTCETAAECIGIALIEDIIFANGYKSITGSNSSMKCRKCECEASFGCHSVSFIESTDEIECDGDSACANAASLQTLNEIDCDGANSCSSAVISNSSVLRCDGEQACAHCSVSSVRSIIVTGAYGLFNSTIDNKNTDLFMYLYSFHAASGATLICQANTICRMTCSGNACSHFYVDCIGQCVFSGDTLPKPIEHVPFFNATAINLLYDSAQIAIQNDLECNNKISFTMDDSYEIGNETIISSDSTVCCRGLYSCSRMHEDDLLINIERSSDDIEYKVICSGASSCWGSYIDNHMGDVVCTGQRACYQSQINTTKSLYCQSPKACYQSNIYNTERLMCTSYKSCGSAVIYTSGSNKTHYFYFYGAVAGGSAVIHCKKSDECIILCGGREACKDIVIQCEQGSSYNVSCDKDSFCPITITPKPTMYPTVYPTMDPTVYLTDNPTAYPLFRTTAMKALTVQNNAIHNNDIVIGMSFIGLLVIAAVVLILIAYRFHRNRLGADPPRYFAVIRFFSGIADWYTDVLWTYSLYIEGHHLFTVSVIFVFGSHLISIVIGLCWIMRWRQNTKQIQVAYFANKYDKYVICLSVVSGFYNATALITSHLFHIESLSLYLDEKQMEYISTVRIFNNSVLENIPVLIIQILYMNSTHSANFIASLAMFFTIISVVAMVLTLVERLVNQLQVMKRVKSDDASNEITLEFILQAMETLTIKTYHIHTYMRLTNAIHAALEIEKSQVKIQRIQKVMRGIKVNVRFVSLDNDDALSIMSGLQDIHDRNQSALYCALLNECKDQLYIHWGSITLRIAHIELTKTEEDNAVLTDQQLLIQHVEMNEVDGLNWETIDENTLTTT